MQNFISKTEASRTKLRTLISDGSTASTRLWNTRFCCCDNDIILGFRSHLYHLSLEGRDSISLKEKKRQKGRKGRREGGRVGKERGGAGRKEKKEEGKKEKQR